MAYTLHNHKSLKHVNSVGMAEDNVIFKIICLLNIWFSWTLDTMHAGKGLALGPPPMHYNIAQYRACSLALPTHFRV